VVEPGGNVGEDVVGQESRLGYMRGKILFG